MFIHALSIRSWLLLHDLGVGGVMEAQVALTLAFSSSLLLGPLSFSSVLTIPHRRELQ